MDFLWINVYGHFLIVTLTFFIVRLDQVASIPSGLVTCLPAQAVPCKLSGNFGTQSDSLIEPFLELVKDDVFRIKVGNYRILSTYLWGLDYVTRYLYNLFKI